jgi:predicted amidophosphoribosyltransferase
MSAETDPDTTEGSIDDEKNPLCPNCKSPINRDWSECALCGQQLTERGGF